MGEPVPPPVRASRLRRTWWFVRRWTVFFTMLLAALLCGVLPAVLSVRRLGWISGGHTDNRASARTSRGLLVFQVAVSFVLLVGAGLMLDTMRALRSIRLGVSLCFETHRDGDRKSGRTGCSRHASHGFHSRSGPAII